LILKIYLGHPEKHPYVPGRGNGVPPKNSIKQNNLKKIHSIFP